MRAGSTIIGGLESHSIMREAMTPKAKRADMQYSFDSEQTRSKTVQNQHAPFLDPTYVPY